MYVSVKSTQVGPQYLVVQTDRQPDLVAEKIDRKLTEDWKVVGASFLVVV